MNNVVALLAVTIAVTACGGTGSTTNAIVDELEAMEAAEAERPVCDDLVGMDAHEVANDELGAGCWYTMPGLDDPTLFFGGVLSEECDDGRVIFTSGPETGWGIDGELWQRWPADGTHPLNLEPHPCS